MPRREYLSNDGFVLPISRVKQAQVRDFYLKSKKQKNTLNDEMMAPLIKSLP
jgi:hypothetical protein